MAISTSNSQDLPDVPTLKRLLQSIAMLDAILKAEWEYRYYSFNEGGGMREASPHVSYDMLRLSSSQEID